MGSGLSRLAWLNCFWLILPILIWNLIYSPKITDTRITSDAHSPAWLLIAENVTRIAIFILPLLIPLPVGADRDPPLLVHSVGRIGLMVYVISTLIYFASWLPLLLTPGSTWSSSIAGLLAPRLTPFLCFLGIAMIGRSWLYGSLAAIFTLLHTWHGIQNL